MESSKISDNRRKSTNTKQTTIFCSWGGQIGHSTTRRLHFIFFRACTDTDHSKHSPLRSLFRARFFLGSMVLDFKGAPCLRTVSHGCGRAVVNMSPKPPMFTKIFKSGCFGLSSHRQTFALTGKRLHSPANVALTGKRCAHRQTSPLTGKRCAHRRNLSNL